MAATSPSDAVKYFCRDFRSLFRAPGYFDRSSASAAIVEARALIRELAPLARRVKDIRKRLKVLHVRTLQALENADPRRSP